MDNSPPQPPPRKACDLCYRRKMKCDGARPRCHNCVSYHSECTYKAASRKTPSRQQVARQRQYQDHDMLARIQNLETQLGSVVDQLGKLVKTQGQPAYHVPACGNNNSDSNLYSGGDVQTGQPASMLVGLPPLHQALALIERYLTGFNSLLPLYDSPTVLRIVRGWYQDPIPKDPVTWALVNIVIALAYLTSSSGEPLGDTSVYVNNAQSVLTDIIMRDTSLASVQVFAGLALLYWATDDLGPALTFIGTALRLAQKLGLHLKDRSQQYTIEERLQRSRVFWMVYILDRDISLQSRLAPLQAEDQIELDLPPLQPDDDSAGFVFAADGQTMNFFRARVELARIQGFVYDYVYSPSTNNLGAGEAAQSIANILQMLDEWGARIPHAFQPRTLALSQVSGLTRYFCILYSTRLSCRALVSFGSASDSHHYSEWMKRLQEYGGKIATGQAVQTAPVPLGWQALAEASREYMALFKSVKLIDTFFTRMTLCAHNSSLLSLIANRLLRIQRHAIDTDAQITRVAMEDLDKISTKIDKKDMLSIRDDVKQLFLYADLISLQTASSLERPLADGLGPEEQSAGSLLGSLDFSNFEDDHHLLPTVNMLWDSLLSDEVPTRERLS